MRVPCSATLFALLMASAAALAQPVRVVAAENFYGDIARQIGGANVTVTSILSNPNQDPHEFEASASTARAIAQAQLIVYNGADYDDWAVKLLAASRAPHEVIEVAALVHSEPGANPHLWYAPSAVSALGAALGESLTRLDAQHSADYAAGLATFEATMERLRGRIAALRAKYQGTAVTATEPVFGYMADALGLSMRNAAFQLAVMNDTEPSAAAIAAFEKDLRTHAVKVLFYNVQTDAALARRMRTLALRVGIPVVSVTETLPRGLGYQAWMLQQLDALERALGKP